MSTLLLQCGTCKFNSELSYEISFPPIRICQEYPDGVPKFVDTIEADEQKTLPEI